MNETNPLELPPPSEDKPVQRVKEFARDLAYGAIRGYWGSVVMVTFKGTGTTSERLTSDQGSLNQIKTKWGPLRPSLDLLVSLGYADVFEKMAENQVSYCLSERAFQLLEAPSIDTGVFISYCRKESSAFALLLLSRMKAMGLDPFLDLNIDPGEEWLPHLEEQIRQCDYFVVAVGKTTLDSKFVQKEIGWAREYGKRIIPIWHNGFNSGDIPQYPAFEDVLGKKNAIIVENENAEAYNNAVIKLLNYLGFTPI